MVGITSVRLEAEISEKAKSAFAETVLDPGQCPDKRALILLLRYMHIARCIDDIEQRLVQQGQAFFHVSGAGHESVAGLSFYLTPFDYLHLHYRDKALLIARGMPVTEFFRSLLAMPSSHSAGRQMSAHYSWPDLNVTSIVGPVGNNALQAAGTAAALKEKSNSAIAVCTIGDGTSQQGEVFEAIAEAARSKLPILFLVEDNDFAISTRTGHRTFFSGPDGPIATLFGLSIARVDGSDPLATMRVLGEAVQFVRERCTPQLVVLSVARLTDHTNADDQSQYRPASELSVLPQRDPIARLLSELRALGVEDSDLKQIREEAAALVGSALNEARSERRPLRPAGLRFVEPRNSISKEHRGTRGSATMRLALNNALRNALLDDPRVFLWGQDIEDPKGDVFGVTKGLSTEFPDRVVNSPLSESTIVGCCIGRALAGQRPVAFIQFADFLPLAANQIISELATMYWRTAGGWNAPVIVMAPIGGFKPGLGPFHAQSFEAMFAQCPGLNVVIPSTAADAAGLLNAARASSQPTLLLYPKALLNSLDAACEADTSKIYVPIGKARLRRTGRHLTLVCWGNTSHMCEAVADRLLEDDIDIDVVDLRSISPWDRELVAESVRKTGRLVVAHEDNITMGFGAEVIAHIAEVVRTPVRARRVGRLDTYIPFNFQDQLAILPSFKRIMDACLVVLGIGGEWTTTANSPSLANAITVIGSGPADDIVKVTDLAIKAGDDVQEGQVVCVVEATKAAVEISAPVTGRISSVLCAIGDNIRVGDPIAVYDDKTRHLAKQGLPDQPMTPEGLAIIGRVSEIRHSSDPNIEIVDIAIKGGDRVITTEELCSKWPEHSALGLVQTTGIRERRWRGSAQTLARLAIDAAKKLVEQTGINAADVGLVIAVTGTPDIATPSLASRVWAEISGPKRQTALRTTSFDINAACSGYLYALRCAHDHLARERDDHVVVVTAEMLSPLLDLDDPETACLFGDAATATLVTAVGEGRRGLMSLRRPILSGAPEQGDLLRVPLAGGGSIKMDGRAVFSEAVRGMHEMLKRCVAEAWMNVSDLDLIIPHQANQRILDAVQRKTSVPVFSAIETWGNTSSSSIPIAIKEAANQGRSLDKVALVAFGGGLTAAAALSENKQI
jgi:2-oxoisovalerate dehydrogenase E1 component